MATKEKPHNNKTINPHTVKALWGLIIENCIISSKKVSNFIIL